MTDIAAYILAIESIEERATDAHALFDSLSAFECFTERKIIPSIYWKEQAAVINFLKMNPEHTFSKEYLDECKKGQLCATLSHIKVWQQLLQSSNDGAMVFEDDIYISDPKNFGLTVQSLINRKDLEWVRVHLHKRFRSSVLELDTAEMFVPDISRWGFATYYVSRIGARKLLRRFLDIERNIDLIVPDMGKSGELKTGTVRKVVVEHHAFEGTEEDLAERDRKEKTMEKLQKSASTIWTSPKVKEDKDFHRFVSLRSNAKQLREDGFTVVTDVFDRAEVENCRDHVLNHLSLFKKTRSASSSRHLAGFHRFPELESLHTMLSSNRAVLDFLGVMLDGRGVQSIGLSDITINRSQCWHKDLLRGRFSTYLDTETDCWGETGGGVFKILFYLQDSASLNVIRGSHLQPISLDSDTHSEPTEDAEVVKVVVEAGDIVFMDIRLSHRGSPESVYKSGQFDDDPKILISTALAAVDSHLTRSMEIGNFHRLMDWMERNP